LGAWVALARRTGTNAGSPTGRESPGDRGPVVVAGVTPRQGGRESRPQGEGGQAVKDDRMPGGMRNAQRRNGHGNPACTRQAEASRELHVTTAGEPDALERGDRGARVGFDRAAPVQLARRELRAYGGGVAVLIVPSHSGGPAADGIPEPGQRLIRDDAAAAGGGAARGGRQVPLAARARRCRHADGRVVTRAFPAWPGILASRYGSGAPHAATTGGASNDSPCRGCAAIVFT
jgi:hypothetical protein